MIDLKAPRLQFDGSPLRKQCRRDQNETETETGEHSVREQRIASAAPIVPTYIGSGKCRLAFAKAFSSMSAASFSLIAREVESSVISM